MNTFFTRSLLRGVGIAASGGVLLGASAMAATTPAATSSERSQAAAEPAPIASAASLNKSESLAIVGASSTESAATAVEGMAPSAAEARVVATFIPADGSAVPSAPQLAQTYPQPVVREGYSAKGWYLTIGAGAQTPSDQTVSSTSPRINPFFTPRLFNFANNNSTTLDLGGGFSGDLGVGYDFGALRTELTYGYSRASLNSVAAANPIGLGVFGIVPFTNNVSGTINKNDVLASLYYDFENNSRWTPYIGGGIGYSNLSTPSFSLNGIPTSSVNKGLFGWQAKAGISYAMSYNSDVYVEGVYQGTGGYSTENLNFGSFNSWGGKIGFRYRFGSSPTAAAPTPQPEPMVQPAPAPMPMPQPQPEPAPVRGLW